MAKNRFVVIEIYDKEEIFKLEKHIRKSLSDIYTDVRITNDIKKLNSMFNNRIYPKPLVYMITIVGRYTVCSTKYDLLRATPFHDQYDGFQRVHNCELFRTIVSYKKKKLNL